MGKLKINSATLFAISIAVVAILAAIMIATSSCKKEPSPSSQTTYCIECNYTGNIPDSQQCNIASADVDEYISDAAEYASYNNQSVNCTKHEQ